MPNLTKNFGLKKPLPEEFYDVNVQNENMDIIDEELEKSKNIFVAEMNVTTFDEVNDAFKAGKIIICTSGFTVMPLMVGAKDTAYRFGHVTLVNNNSIEFNCVTISELSGQWSEEPTVVLGYNYGTEDLIAGESRVKTGTLYFVYE